MTMQDNIGIFRRNVGRNMHEAKLQSFARKIDNERPVFIPVAIPAHNSERRADRFQIERDRRLANIAQMPDLIRVARKIDNLLRQFVMSVRQDKNPKHLIAKESKNAGRERPFSNLFSWVPAFLRDDWRASCEALT